MLLFLLSDFTIIYVFSCQYTEVRIKEEKRAIPKLQITHQYHEIVTRIKELQTGINKCLLLLKDCYKSKVLIDFK